MLKNLQNLDIKSCSDAELNIWIRQVIPTIINFLYACQRLSSSNKYPDHSPCKNCPNAEACKFPCESLEKELPGIFSGSHILNNTFSTISGPLNSNKTTSGDYHENPNNYDYNYLKTIDRIRSDEIFMLYKNCSNIFSKREWRVVALRIKDGNIFKKVGEILGISTSTASDTFQRAKKKMENYYRRKVSEKGA